MSATRPKVSEPSDPRIASALAMLEAGAKVAEVAKACGVSDRTIARWRLRHPTIRDAAELALEAVKRDALSSVSDAIKDIAAEARKSVARLVAIRDDKDAPQSDRVRASIALLDRAGIVGGLKVEHNGSVEIGGASDAVMDQLRAERARREEAPQGTGNGPPVAK